jgi:phosphatidylserine decarboxylase
VRRPLAAHDLRAGRAILGQPDHGARRTGIVRAQRARSVRVRWRVRPVRVDAGGRHHRRQHGHGVARPGQEIALQKGDEMGRFLLGSTVVMLLPKDTLRFNLEWSSTRTICMGEAMGSKAI